MQQSKFEAWLNTNKYDSGTISSRVSNCLRVEEYEGDLDSHYNYDGMEELYKRLQYTIDDKNHKKAANHSIPINGDIYNGTATLRSAVNLYKKFLYDISRDKEIFSKETFESKQVTPISSEKQKLDSYEKFFQLFCISKDQFYEYGLKETILPDINSIREQWSDLKERLFSGREVFIRGAGRDAKGTDIYLEFYSNLFGNDKIKKDPTNNHKPQQILQLLTGYKRNKSIFNYQVSHIFGRTKNPLLFEASWNLSFVPKIIDPLTGHETQGHWPKEYQELFLNMIKDKYKEFIEEYNTIISGLNIEKKLNDFIKSHYTETKKQEFIKGVSNELSLIKL